MNKQIDFHFFHFFSVWNDNSMSHSLRWCASDLTLSAECASRDLMKEVKVDFVIFFDSKQFDEVFELELIM